MRQKLYTLLVLLLGCTLVAPAQTLLERANNAYSEENYGEAIELYNQAVEQEGISSSLYYNLGNAYYKESQYSAAILNYERALLLDPSSEDASFNLKLAQSHIVDQIEPIGSFFLTLWVQSVARMLTTNGWAIVAIVTFILALAATLLYLFSRRTALRKVAFFGGLVLLLVSIGANRFSYTQKQQLTQRNAAIIFAPTVSVKSSPAESGTDLFVLHEGTKVTILDRIGEWVKVILADGNQGWLPSDKLEVI